MQPGSSVFVPALSPSFRPGETKAGIHDHRPTNEARPIGHGKSRGYGFRASGPGRPRPGMTESVAAADHHGQLTCRAIYPTLRPRADRAKEPSRKNWIFQ